MSNLTIFKNPGAVAKAPLRQSALGQQIADTMRSNVSRIQTNTNGTFKRIVKGEQVGKAIRGEFNAIIVAMLAKPGRTYYAKAYDPDAKPTLPDCWSDVGDVPVAGAANKQASNCASCPQNITGSGTNGKGKACRFQRKVALLLEGEDQGEVYQFQIPAKSLFGDGDGNSHPFESYCRFLVSNGTAPDMVVTNIAYNLDAETMELVFTPVRPITDEEYDAVTAAQADPATEKLIRMTAGEADGAKVPAPERKAIAAKPVVVEEEDDEDDEPVVQTPKKAAPKAEPIKASADLASIVDAWKDDEDED